MTLTARVFTPDGEISVSDNAAGDDIITEMQERYLGQKVKVWIYGRNDIWGKGYDGVKPMLKTTIDKFEW